MVQDMLISSLIMYMKKTTHFWLAENECILMNTKRWYECELQIASVRFQISSVLTSYNVFLCTLLTSNKMASLEIWCNKHLKFSKDYKLHFPYGLVQFCSLWKIHSY